MENRKAKTNHVSRIDVKCSACGCDCGNCMGNTFDLHQEIEELKSALSKKDEQVLSIENQALASVEECRKLEQSLQINTNKYERLMESHRKLQKLNQNLEEKLLKMADKALSEEALLNARVGELDFQLGSAQNQIAQLEQHTETYKRDCNIAIRLLQQKPTQFISHHFETLPNDVQQRVNQYLAFKKSDGESPNSNSDFSDRQANRSPPRPSKSLHYSIPTFPPTSMNAFYSVQDSSSSLNTPDPNTTSSSANNYVPASLMAQILEDRARERNYVEINLPNDVQTCPMPQTVSSFGTQIDSNDAIQDSDPYRSRHRRNLSNEIQAKQQQVPSGAYYRSSTPSNIMTV